MSAHAAEVQEIHLSYTPIDVSGVHGKSESHVFEATAVFPGTLERVFYAFVGRVVGDALMAGRPVPSLHATRVTRHVPLPTRSDDGSTGDSKK